MLRWKRKYFGANTVSFTPILVHACFFWCMGQFGDIVLALILMHVVLALILVHVSICGACFLSASSSIGFIFGYILHVLDVNVYLDIYACIGWMYMPICVFDECIGQICKLFACTLIFVLV